MLAAGECGEWGGNLESSAEKDLHVLSSHRHANAVSPCSHGPGQTSPINLINIYVELDGNAFDDHVAGNGSYSLQKCPVDESDDGERVSIYLLLIPGIDRARSAHITQMLL